MSHSSETKRLDVDTLIDTHWSVMNHSVEELSKLPAATLDYMGMKPTLVELQRALSNFYEEHQRSLRERGKLS